MRGAVLCPPFVRARRTLLSCFGLVGEKARQPAAHRISFFRGPFAKALAGFHAKLAGLDLVAQEWVRSRRAVKVAIKHLRDIELKIKADEVRLLHGPEHRCARAESFAHDCVDRLSIADTRRDQRDSFAFHRVLKPVADESRNVAADMNRHFSGPTQQLHGSFYNIAAGLLVLNDFDQRHQMRRIPEMRADHPFAMHEMSTNLSRGNRRTVAGEYGRRRDQLFDGGEYFLLERQLL